MSAKMSQEARLSAVRGLASLPLFQLSTAGMELFHTNMLYRLATERPDESIAVWNALGLTAGRVDDHTPFIRREWRHVDLVAWPGDDQPALVLENKIGAIPGPAQLDGYYAGLRSAQPPFSLKAAKFVLLTLIPPAFEPSEPWRSVTYRKLLPALRETAQRMTGDDAGLLETYVDLVQRLDELATAYAPAANLNAPFALSTDERNLLLELRLLSLVEKVRTARFAELLTRSLPADIGAAGEAGTGYTNGSAIYQWFMPSSAGRRFGWQVQNGAFRLAVIMGARDPEPIARKVGLVADQYSSFFNFEAPGHLAHLLGPYVGRKLWLTYKPSFVYRYRPLAPDTTWNELLALAIWFSRHTHAHVVGFSG
jgi:hypothetical protein